MKDTDQRSRETIASTLETSRPMSFDHWSSFLHSFSSGICPTSVPLPRNCRNGQHAGTSLSTSSIYVLCDVLKSSDERFSEPTTTKASGQQRHRVLTPSQSFWKTTTQALGFHPHPQECSSSTDIHVSRGLCEAVVYVVQRCALLVVLLLQVAHNRCRQSRFQRDKTHDQATYCLEMVKNRQK